MTAKIFYHDVNEANKVIVALQERNADLEDVIQAISENCTLRLDGLCDLTCRGRILCNCQKLETIQELDRQAGVDQGLPPDQRRIDPTD
jgi:hypothetical protein